MKQTSRKKVLLSSAAMLMVATVSLGSATYAWFTNSSSAKAKNIQVQTTKLSNLQVTETPAVESSWGNEVDFNVNATLLPASTGNLTAWYHTTAADETKYDRDTTATISTVTTDADYVIAKTFSIRSKDVEANNVQWTLDLNGTDATAQKYIRVALVGGDGNVVYSNNETSTLGLTGTTGSTTALTSSSAITGELFDNLPANTAKTLTLYVWFEGQDTDCYNGTAGATAKVSVSFSKA